MLKCAFGGEDLGHQKLYPEVLTYLATLDESLETSLKALSRQIICKGKNIYRLGDEITFTYDEFKKFVPAEVLTPPGVRLYSQFYLRKKE